jgi:hypothetical protein
MWNEGAGMRCWPGTARMTSLGIAASATGSPSPLRGSHPATQIAFTRTAWCDLDGDSAIDLRPALQGGDAVMLVPTHDVSTTYPRGLDQLEDARPQRPLRPIVYPTRGTERRYGAAAFVTRFDGDPVELGVCVRALF